MGPPGCKHSDFPPKYADLDEFLIGSYLKVKFLSDFTKNTVVFWVLVRGKIFLYHLKAYL